MFAYAAIPLTCWLCALLAIPRKPRFGNEVEELVYSRLLGRRELLALLALFVTAITLLVMVTRLPQRLDPDLTTVRQAREACGAARNTAASDAADYHFDVRFRCYVLQPGGAWAEQLMQDDGSWLLVATLAGPPRFARPMAPSGSAAYRP